MLLVADSLRWSGFPDNMPGMVRVVVSKLAEFVAEARGFLAAVVRF